MFTEIEQLQVEPDQPARVIVDERSGIIVMGRDVRLSIVAVAQLQTGADSLTLADPMRKAPTSSHVRLANGSQPQRLPSQSKTTETYFDCSDN